MNPYVEGAEYLRAELLSFLGSRQRQSGVLWGPREPGCLICTSGGRHGRKAGYEDEEFPGGWTYVGQGTTGDQSLSNAANSKLASGFFSIFLFTTREPTAVEVRETQSFCKRFRYRGEFNVLDYELVRVSRGVRAGDTLIRFNLVRVTDETSLVATFADIDFESLAATQINLYDSEVAPIPIAVRTTNYWLRSYAVRQYAMKRANGICEGCSNPAPFKNDAGVPFLEIHHIVRLADTGLDAPGNVVALCPNCHRRAHYSADRHEYRRFLFSRVKENEVRSLDVGVSSNSELVKR